MLYKMFVENWKTTIGGLVVLIFTFLLGFKQITVEEFGIYSGAIVSLMLVFTKDADKPQGK